MVLEVVRGVSTRSPHPPIHRLGITAGAIGVVAAVVAALGSWIPSFWGDEAASIMSAQRPLPTLFSMLGNVDAVHGTYYLFLHFWVGAFGASPFSVRLPSALAIGIAAVGVVFLTNRLADYRMAVYAGIVAILLPRLTVDGIEARAYAISAACAIWLTYLLIGLVDRGERRAVAWWGYASLLAVSVYVFAFSVLVGAAHLLILLMQAESRKLVRQWAVAAAVGLVAAAPVLITGYLERQQISFLSRRTAATVQSVFVGQWFGNVVYAALAWTAIAVILALTVMRVGTRMTGHLRVHQFRWLKAWPHRIVVVSAAVALLPPVVLLTVNLVSAVYTNRYLAMSAPAVAVLLGYALSALPKRWGVAALLVLSIVAVPSYLQQRTVFAKNESDWAQVADVVRSHAVTGDGIVFDESTRPSLRLRLAMHTYPQAFSDVTDLTLRTPFSRNSWWWDATYRPSSVPQRFVGVGRLWLLEYRFPGKSADTYGMAELQLMGFQVQRSYDLHRSVVYELSRV
ncbi:glycosyltransferase family 39 protein [Glaciibacter sp. 2TAF33]|uniref:glycosyltransferase family 39 protein n=1 Tax=Glaciibacter sp. 2TAF33 TaxID=3233015 RepID=UPI003F8F835E